MLDLKTPYQTAALTTLGTTNTNWTRGQMAEIKSTLDIIMEKAKRFSVTEEEKKGFKRQELEGKIKGLVQKVCRRYLGF